MAQDSGNARLEALRRYDHRLYEFALSEGHLLVLGEARDADKFLAAHRRTAANDALASARADVERITGKSISPLEEKAYLWKNLPRIYGEHETVWLESDTPCETCVHESHVLEGKAKSLDMQPSKDSGAVEEVAAIVSNCPNPEAYDTPRSFACAAYKEDKKEVATMFNTKGKTFHYLWAYRRQLGREIFQSGMLLE